MVCQAWETIGHFPPPPPLSDGSFISPPRPIALPFQRPRQIHQPTIKSQPMNSNTHLCILDNPINSSTYASILDSCTCPNLGEQLHAHTIKSSFHGHEFVETKVLQMYGRCGCFNNASLLFDAMPLRNLYSWTAILNVHLDLGLFDDAISIFQQLLFEDIELDFFLFPVVLKVCNGLGMVELGEQLHGMATKYKFVSNIYVGNALIDMYGKCGYLGNAKKVFQNMPVRDCVSWNSMLTACAANGMVYEALEFLERMSLVDSFSPNLVSWSAVIGGFAQNGYDKETVEMLARMQAEGQKPNGRTLASVLPACAKLQKLDLGRELHGYIMRHGFMSNSFVVNGLVDVYRRCGHMRTALKIFSWLSVKNTVSFNTMIVGYCEKGEMSRAREFFDQMNAAGIKKDIISWNSLISGYVDNFLFEEALSTFSDLLMVEELEPDSFTLGSVLTASADMASLRQGKELHSYAIAKGLHCNTFVGVALVEMYCKCQDLEAAQTAFDEITEKDIATWNALVSGYARCNQIESIKDLLQKMKRDGYEPNIYTWNGIIAGHVENGHHDVAMQLFCEMQASDLKPDIYTIGIILPACSRLITLERGKQIHAVSVRCGYDSDVHIGAALVDMYSKCGSIKYASFAYNRIADPNLVSQNAMLTAYATHGLGEEGVDFFRRMLAMGIRPDHVTFLSVLSACVHAGSVETGHEFFDLMGYYGLKPTLKHYTCMVDLLSRTGQLNEAYKFIKNMPMEPDLVLWSALLGGCVIHVNVGIGEIAAKRLIELEPSDAGNYVLLANLYAFAGRWSDLARTRQLMKDRGMQKSPGCSWIEDKDEIHVFLASDRSHMRTNEIYATVDTLNLHIKRHPVISQ